MKGDRLGESALTLLVVCAVDGDTYGVPVQSAASAIRIWRAIESKGHL